MILYVNVCGTTRSQREITGLPASATAPRPSPGLAPRSVRIKIFISERSGCYGPLPVLARHGRNGGVRRLMRLALPSHRAHQLIGSRHRQHRSVQPLQQQHRAASADLPGPEWWPA